MSKYWKKGFLRYCGGRLPVDKASLNLIFCILRYCHKNFISCSSGTMFCSIMEMENADTPRVSIR